MSRYTDVNQLLEEMGTSARSADDPWTLARHYRGTVKRNPFIPAVVADLGGSAEEATSQMQASQRVTRANTVASGPTTNVPDSGSTWSGSGFLGGLLNFFPLASGIAKLFGFGDSPQVPALTPYALPPSISFGGAVTGPESGITSLSYGSDGLPRSAARSDRDSSPAEMLSVVTGTSGDMSGDIRSIVGSYTNKASDKAMVNPTESEVSSGANTPPMVTQLAALSPPMFSTEPSDTKQTLSANVLSGPNMTSARGSSSDASTPSTAGQGRSEVSPASSQQGQSILVQVQAMDSQSFMDHSQEIAQAVRQAMLNLNSLNDVIADL